MQIIFQELLKIELKMSQFPFFPKRWRTWPGRYPGVTDYNIIRVYRLPGSKDAAQVVAGKYFSAEILVLLSGAEMTKVKLSTENLIDLRWLVKQRPLLSG